MTFTSTSSKLISTLFLLASFTSKATGQTSGATTTCQLCPNGGEIAFPDQVVPINDESGTTTCAAFDAELGGVTEADCGTTLDGYGSLFSFAALCGCTDVTPPVICDLCGNGDLIDPDRVTPDGSTCGYAVELAPYAASEEICSSLLGVLGRPVCCTSPDPTEGSSAPASKFVVALTSDMFLVGTMMMMLA
jgi:hypothetical protein